MNFDLKFDELDGLELNVNLEKEVVEFDNSSNLLETNPKEQNDGEHQMTFRLLENVSDTTRPILIDRILHILKMVNPEETDSEKRVSYRPRISPKSITKTAKCAISEKVFDTKKLKDENLKDSLATLIRYKRADFVLVQCVHDSGKDGENNTGKIFLFQLDNGSGGKDGLMIQAIRSRMQPTPTKRDPNPKGENVFDMAYAPAFIVTAKATKTKTSSGVEIDVRDWSVEWDRTDSPLIDEKGEDIEVLDGDAEVYLKIKTAQNYIKELGFGIVGLLGVELTKENKAAFATFGGEHSEDLTALLAQMNEFIASDAMDAAIKQLIEKVPSKKLEELVLREKSREYVAKSGVSFSELVWDSSEEAVKKDAELLETFNKSFDYVKAQLKTGATLAEIMEGGAVGDVANDEGAEETVIATVTEDSEQSDFGFTDED